MMPLFSCDLILLLFHFYAMSASINFGDNVGTILQVCIRTMLSRGIITSVTVEHFGALLFYGYDYNFQRFP